LECSTNARLLFVGLWNFADDKGRHPDSPLQCKAEVFPADCFSLAEIRGMLDELSRNGLIKRYEFEGKGFFYIPGWHHQRIDKPQPPKYPDPFDERSQNVPGTLPPDTKGKDTKGNEQDMGGKPPACKGDPPEFAELKSQYPKRAGDQRWRDTLKACKARIREGHTWDEILDGAKRYAAWCSASGSTGTEFVKQAATFVGPNKSFLEAWDVTKKPNGAFGKPVRIEDKLAHLRRLSGEETGGESLDPPRGDVRGSVLEGVFRRAE